MKTYTIVLDIGDKRVEIDFRASNLGYEFAAYGKALAYRMGLKDVYVRTEEKEE